VRTMFVLYLTVIAAGIVLYAIVGLAHQSEFLAVGSMAILAVYLRQRGSPESKPVGAPHDATGVEG